MPWVSLSIFWTSWTTCRG